MWSAARVAGAALRRRPCEVVGSCVGSSRRLSISQRTLHAGKYLRQMGRTVGFAASRSKVTFSFVEPSGEEIVVECEEGTNLLDLAHDNDIEMEGACGGECACSTCHVILDEGLYARLEADAEIDEEEEDMLDLAIGLTDTSRLGCQVKVKAHFEGVKIRLPDEVESFY